jgi:hypothetical protein
VQRPVRSVFAAGKRFSNLAELEEWPGQASSADEETRPLVFAGCRQMRLEQLPYHSIGEVPLELAPSGAQHLEPEGLRVLARSAEQP